MEPGTLWTMRYDRDRQLLGVYESVPDAPPAAPQRLWGQQYDASGNRTSHQQPGRTETASYNARNQLTSLSGGGTTVFRGSVSEPAQVTLDGKPARVFSDGSFEASLALGPGVRQVTLEATDRAANPLRPRVFGGKGAEGVKMGIPSNNEESCILELTKMQACSIFSPWNGSTVAFCGTICVSIGKWLL